jgi:hypothetical protein
MKCLSNWIPVLCFVMIGACSSENDVTAATAHPSGDSAWQAQEDAYKKAQQVQPIMDDADRRQRALLEQQGG